MKKFYRQSIKAHTIIIFAVLTLILVTLLARISYVTVKDIYLEQLHEQVNLLSSIAANELDIRFLDFIEPESESAGAQHYLNKLREAAEQLKLSDLFVFDSSGSVLLNTGTQNTEAGILLNLADIKKLKVGQAFNSLPFKALDRDWYLWNYRRLNEKYYLGLRESSTRLARIERLANWFLAIGLLGLVLVLFAGWYVGRRIAQPVNKLVQFSSEIGKGNFKAQPAQDIYGELAVLQQALIKMRDGLASHQQEKEYMLAQIAHELRNPLGGISLLAGLIKEELATDTKNAEYAQRILDETEGLKNQISAYLNFSKPMEANMQTFSIAEIFDAMKEEYHTKLQKQNIALELENHSTSISFDRMHLRQVLNNCVDNSMRAIGQNGTIRISAENKHLSISDDGPGIAPENLAKVFDPFYTSNADGAGLGLAICKKLCRENGADLEVENNFLEGCTFTIKLG